MTSSFREILAQQANAEEWKAKYEEVAAKLNEKNTIIKLLRERNENVQAIIDRCEKSGKKAEEETKARKAAEKTVAKLRKDKETMQKMMRDHQRLIEKLHNDITALKQDFNSFKSNVNQRLTTQQPSTVAEPADIAWQVLQLLKNPHAANPDGNQRPQPAEVGHDNQRKVAAAAPPHVQTRAATKSPPKPRARVQDNDIGDKPQQPAQKAGASPQKAVLRKRTRETNKEVTSPQKTRTRPGDGVRTRNKAAAVTTSATELGSGAPAHPPLAAVDATRPGFASTAGLCPSLPTFAAFASISDALHRVVGISGMMSNPADLGDEDIVDTQLQRLIQLPDAASDKEETNELVRNAALELAEGLDSNAVSRVRLLNGLEYAILSCAKPSFVSEAINSGGASLSFTSRWHSNERRDDAIPLIAQCTAQIHDRLSKQDGDLVEMLRIRLHKQVLVCLLQERPDATETEICALAAGVSILCIQQQNLDALEAFLIDLLLLENSNEATAMSRSDDEIMMSHSVLPAIAACVAMCPEVLSSWLHKDTITKKGKRSLESVRLGDVVHGVLYYMCRKLASQRETGRQLVSGGGEIGRLIPRSHPGVAAEFLMALGKEHWQWSSADEGGGDRGDMYRRLLIEACK